MQRYFFHTADGAPDRDTEGFDLPDHAAARLEAARYAGALIRDVPGTLWDDGELRIQVTDDTGRKLFTIITLATDTSAPTT